MPTPPLTLSIAGIPVRFQLPVSFAGPLKRAFKPFVSGSRKPAATIDIALMKKRGGPGKRPRVVADGRSLTVHRGDMAFSFDTKTMKGRLIIVPDRFVFNAFLRILYASLLPFYDGFLLHASAVAVKGRGWAFAGPSGAGKTTVAGLLSSHSVLSDELAALRPEKGAIRIYGTPFQGEFAGARRAIRVPLTALYLLHKSDVTAERPIVPGTALKRLLRCVVFFSPEAESVARVIAAAERLIDSGRVKELAFSKDRAEFLKGFTKLMNLR